MTTNDANPVKRLEAIIHSMTSMAESRSADQALSLLLRKGLELSDAKWGWVQLINSSGELAVSTSFGVPKAPPPFSYGQGLFWKAIIERKPQIANDVSSEEWKKWYLEVSNITRAELSIPLIIDRVRVREGTSTKLRSQAIGVLHLGNSEVGTFSEDLVSELMPLMRQAALLVDWLDAEKKLAGLREVEKEIVGQKNWRDVLQTVVTAIRDTLGFHYVNVSLVDVVGNLIRSEYIVGMPETEIESLKEMAVHSLDGPDSDIQVDVVKSGKIEVPEGKDPRFDSAIFERFGHHNLIRVFIPMKVPSTGEIIGTVEAGYNRRYRDFISERDIQFLQSFIAYVVEAIEPGKRALVETVSHELRSSIVGIRSNADYLRTLWPRMSQEMIEAKLSDMLADCEILLLNVSELEYFLGRTPQAAKVEKISLGRDVIVRTVLQLKPFVRERKFDPKRIDYTRVSRSKIDIYADRARLNQVVYNLLLNAIKYAEDDPDSFSIQIGATENREHFVLSLADWGIGVRAGFEESIFNYGFRAPEAQAKNVSGSGLGLTIARARMRELGGDLILVRTRKPTEFQLWIPKKLAEAPK